jgi:hypothetical protein
MAICSDKAGGYQQLKAALRSCNKQGGRRAIQKISCQNAEIARKMRAFIAGTTFFCNSDTTLYHYIMTGRFAVPVC